MHTIYMFKANNLIKSVITSCGILMTLFSSVAKADVLINLEQPNEISISNNDIGQNYSLKIEELQLGDNALQTNPRTTAGINSTKQLPYNNEVIIAANETALEPALIHAVIAVESKHNAHAISKKGAYGLMQLMPATAQRFKVLDKNDVHQNILAGAKYLRELLTLFNGDLKLSLAAYNAGPAAVQKYQGHIPPYLETINYVPKVLKYYRLYS